MSLLPARDAGSERCGSNKSRRCKKLPGSPPLDDLTLMEANPNSSFRFPSGSSSAGGANAEADGRSCTLRFVEQKRTCRPAQAVSAASLGGSSRKMTSADQSVTPKALRHHAQIEGRSADAIVQLYRRFPCEPRERPRATIGATLPPSLKATMSAMVMRSSTSDIASRTLVIVRRTAQALTLRQSRHG
jgi:hypothetical protein